MFEGAFTDCEDTREGVPLSVRTRIRCSKSDLRCDTNQAVIRFTHTFVVNKEIIHVSILNNVHKQNLKLRFELVATDTEDEATIVRS